MTIKEYAFRRSSQFRGKRKAQAVGERLSLLAEKGCIGPGEVVRDAEPLDSPLHEYFTWDDTSAARLHRLEEARELIRSVAVVVVGRDDQRRISRAFVTLRPAGTRRPEPYQDINRVMGDAEKRKALLAIALAEARAWMDRYEHFRELAGVFAAIKRASRRSERRRHRAHRKRT